MSNENENKNENIVCVSCLVIIQGMSKQNEIIIYGFIAFYFLLFVISTEGCVKCEKNKRGTLKRNNNKNKI